MLFARDGGLGGAAAPRPRRRLYSLQLLQVLQHLRVDKDNKAMGAVSAAAGLVGAA